MACYGFPGCVALWSVWLLLASPAVLSAQGSDTAEARSETDEEKPEGVLPPGLIQNRTVLPEMEIVKELYTDEQENKFKRETKRGFDEALKGASLGDKEKKLLEEGAKYWVLRFTMEKYYREETPKPDDSKAKDAGPKERLHDLRKTLLSDIRLFAKTPAVREYFLKQLTEQAKLLLDNNFVVRQNILLLLGQLPLDNGDLKKGIEPAPYDPAYSVLLDVIKDDKQHQAIKITALVGLNRICRFGLKDFNDKRRVEIAMALVAELGKKNLYYWYEVRLVECLGETGVSYDPADKTNPAVLQKLAEILVDQSKHFWVRSEAARAIGRLPLDNSINITPVTHHIVKLGYQMMLGYNAKPKGESWMNYFFTPPGNGVNGSGLYFAFKSDTASSRVLGGKRKPGLLEALPGSKDVKDAYEQVLQMTLHFIDNPGKPFPDAKLKSIESWIANHPITNNKLTSNSPPLVEKPGPATPPKNTNGKANGTGNPPVVGPE
jgi:hypothetical protein